MVSIFICNRTAILQNILTRINIRAEARCVMKWQLTFRLVILCGQVVHGCLVSTMILQCSGRVDLKKKLLKTKEKAEADDGYVGEENTICHPSYARSKEDFIAKAKARKRHETVNGRLKKFKALSELYRHDIGTHSYVFQAVVVLVQLSFNNGEKPYQVHY